MVGERVAATVAETAHAKKGAGKIARHVMVPGQSPVKEAATVAVADGVVAAVGVVPGGIAQIVPRALTQTASLSHWTRLPHLA